MKFLLTALFIAAAGPAAAQLVVAVSPVQVVGQKAVVPFALRNGLGEKVESARAAVFLSDAQGKIVGQGVRWIIGGDSVQPGLAAGATNAFHFVVASDRPFASTNLTARVVFSRVLLSGGKEADASRDVKIDRASR